MQCALQQQASNKSTSLRMCVCVLCTLITKKFPNHGSCWCLAQFHQKPSDACLAKPKPIWSLQPVSSYQLYARASQAGYTLAFQSWPSSPLLAPSRTITPAQIRRNNSSKNSVVLLPTRMFEKEPKFLLLWYLVLKEQGRAELAARCSSGTSQRMCMTILQLPWHYCFLLKKRISKERKAWIMRAKWMEWFHI